MRIGDDRSTRSSRWSDRDGQRNCPDVCNYVEVARTYACHVSLFFLLDERYSGGHACLLGPHGDNHSIRQVCFLPSNNSKTPSIVDTAEFSIDDVVGIVWV